jgi:hypothetical protein
MSPRRSVLESARSRSVARDRTADGRLFFTRGIRREEQAGCCCVFLYVTDDCARSNSYGSGLDVKILDLIQGSKGKQHSLVGDRRSRGTGLRTGGSYRHSVGGRSLDELYYIVDRFWSRHHVGNKMKTG